MQLARCVPINVTLYASLAGYVGKLQFFPSLLLIINDYVQSMCCHGQQVQHVVNMATSGNNSGLLPSWTLPFSTMKMD